MLEKLGKYHIETLLGEGSFAWVYRAMDEGLERPVALKVLKPAWLADPQALARFKQEAKTMARLHHPHIVVIHEVGEAEGQAAQDLNVDITFDGPGNESEVDKQIELLQAALDKNPAAICFAALDSQAATPLLEKAQAAHIPIIGFDSGIDSDIPMATVTTDNIAAAAYAADKMAELIGWGEVAVIAHDQTSRTGIDRVKGFTDRMKEKYPDITIVDVQYGESDPQKSKDITKALIIAHPSLRGFFGTNEGSMKGVMDGVKEMYKEGLIVMIGYDAGKQLKDEIQAGVVTGAISQDPVSMGYKCIEAAVKAIKGETLPKMIDTGFKWYDSFNIASEEMKPLLYD